MSESYRILGTLGGEGIYLAELGGRKVVLKRHRYFEVEARMLQTLAPYLNVPEVLEIGSDYFAMECVEQCSSVDEREAAEALVALHVQCGERFGLHFHTTIGPHFQSNTPHDSWIDFYRDERVLAMAKGCLEAGRFDAGTMRRIEALCGRFGELLFEPVPSLLHGDIWSGNVLCKEKKPCFIDPALYYGHNEVELAFIALFDTFGKRFFDAYGALRPIEAGFFEERIHLYQLYPALVHVRSFGGSYTGMLDRLLGRFE